MRVDSVFEFADSFLIKGGMISRLYIQLRYALTGLEKAIYNQYLTLSSPVIGGVFYFIIRMRRH